MNKGISIIICCYNSEKVIESTLKAAFGLYIPKSINCEIILVDNNCTDSTVTVARELAKSKPKNISFSIIKEPESGLSYARKAGVLNAKFEYILFCDDDNWLATDYLKQACQILERNKKVGALGGQSEAISSIEFPSWFEAIKSNYAVGQQAKESGIIDSRGYLWGAGLVVRKSLLVNFYKLGIKSVLLDRKGELLGSGGDSEICQWILWSNFHLWYDEQLKFKHFISPKRLTKSYFQLLMQGHDESHEKLKFYYFFTKIISQKNLTVNYPFQSILKNYETIKTYNHSRLEKEKSSTDSKFQTKSLATNQIKAEREFLLYAYLQDVIKNQENTIKYKQEESEEYKSRLNKIESLSFLIKQVIRLLIRKIFFRKK